MRARRRELVADSPKELIDPVGDSVGDAAFQPFVEVYPRPAVVGLVELLD